MMRAEAIEPQKLSSDDIAAWRMLLRQDSIYSSPYLTPEWALLVNRFRPDARVVVFREDDKPVGFLPVQSAFGGAAMPLGGPVCDYQALIAAKGVELDPRLALKALEAPRIDFTYVVGDDGVNSKFLKIADPGHVVDLSGGWKAYEDERRAAGSNVLKRTRKKLNKMRRECKDVTFNSFVRDDDAFETLLSWKRAQHKRTGTTDVLSRAWIRYLVEASYREQQDEFGGELFTLHADGELAAGIFCLRAGKTLHAWYVGYNIDLEDYSPGFILFAEAMHAAAEAGFDQFDLGPGDYRFKTSFANSSRMAGPGFLGGLNFASALRQLEYSTRYGFEHMPLGRFSALPGKAMRRIDVWRSMSKGASNHLMV